jgi:hypothetical protein
MGWSWWLSVGPDRDSGPSGDRRGPRAASNGQSGGDHADAPGHGAPPRCADCRRSGDFAGEWPRPPWPAPDLPRPAVRAPPAAAPKRSSRWGTPQDSRRVARWNGQSSSPAPEQSVWRRCGENAQRFLEYRAARAGGGSRAGRPPVGPVDPWPCRPWTRRPPSPRRRPGPGGCARHIAAWHASPVRGRRRQRTCRCSASWRPPPV